MEELYNIKEKNVKYFKIYTKLPLILACVTLLLFFVYGIIDSTLVFAIDYDEYVYGVMLLPNGFLAWFIWMIIGGVMSAITYFSLKIALSYKILHICYLYKISTHLNTKLTKNGIKITTVE